ncbi:hypothetical protein [Geodermatophilus sp. SYSU D01036]
MTRSSLRALRAAAPLAASAAPASAAPATPTFTEPATSDVAGEVAEILSVTPDGRTVVYTDPASGEVGLVDLGRPDRPRQAGAVEVGGEPTSVAVTQDGRRALVVVDDTDGESTTPSGPLVVVDLRTLAVVAEHGLARPPSTTR